MSQSAQTIFEMANNTSTDSDTEPDADVVTHGDFKLELDTTMSEPITSPGKSIPRSIEQDTRFIGWRYEDGGDSKAPLTPEFRNGSARRTDGTTLTGVEKSYAYALGWVNQSQERLDSNVSADGVGLILTEEDPYLCFDFDDVRDPETGLTEQWCVDLIQQLDSYTELSPSGTGFHTLVRAPAGLDDDYLTECAVGSETCALKESASSASLEPAERAPKSALELYEVDHYVTFTTERIEDSPYDLAERGELARDIQRAMMDEDTSDTVDTTSAPRESIEADTGSVDGDVIDAVVERASEADEDFEALFNGRIPPRYDDDHSRADMALCSKLSWWCNSDTTLIDACFQRSGLMRAKWDADRGSITYGRLTIRNANKKNPDNSGINW